MLEIRLHDEIIRSALHQDIRLAWGGQGLKAIHDDRPRVPKTRANLPYAVVGLRRVEPSTAESGPQTVRLAFLYSILGVFPMPTEGLLEAIKVERVQELVSQLTEELTYAGIATERLPVLIDLVPELEITEGDTEPVFGVEVQFEVVVYDQYV